MKKNFDTSALRKTAADIQGAVVPKSVTADMVGGLFSALVEAQGEVIEALGALEREVVTVKVNGYDGEQRVSAAGAKHLIHWIRREVMGYRSFLRGY